MLEFFVVQELWTRTPQVGSRSVLNRSLGEPPSNPPCRRCATTARSSTPERYRVRVAVVLEPAPQLRSIEPELREVVAVLAVFVLSVRREEPLHPHAAPLAARGKSPAFSLALVAPLGPAETCGTAQYSGVSSKPREPTIAAREPTGLSPRPARVVVVPLEGAVGVNIRGQVDSAAPLRSAQPSPQSRRRCQSGSATCSLEVYRSARGPLAVHGPATSRALPRPGGHASMGRRVRAGARDGRWTRLSERDVRGRRALLRDARDGEPPRRLVR